MSLTVCAQGLNDHLKNQKNQITSVGGTLINNGYGPKAWADGGGDTTAWTGKAAVSLWDTAKSLRTSRKLQVAAAAAGAAGAGFNICLPLRYSHHGSSLALDAVINIFI